MPLVLPLGAKLTDANNNPISGGGVRVRVADTTDLANLFSDNSLSVAITNPVVTDSAGYPANGGNECAINVAAGTYDVAFLDASGVVIASWDDFVPFGAESGELERTVPGNGRFKVTGSAGAVKVWFGDPDPDDTGGTVTESGWDDTQGDTKTVNFATFNVSGRSKEGGRKIASTVLTEATAFSATATVDVSLPNTPSGVRAYRVTFYDLTFASATQPRLRLSYAGSLKSGASDYSYVVNYYSIGGSAFAVGTDDAAAFIDLHGENFNGTATISADKVARIVLEIVTPNSGTADTLVRWAAEGYTTSGTPFPTLPTGSAHGLGQYGRCDGLRLLNSGGVNMAGKYVVESLAGFGD